MPDAPRVTLVLGAGGSVGHAYHLGVLSALADELGWDARTAGLIIGTSAGSVVGAGLRAGLSAPDMRARALGRPMSEEGRTIVRRGEAAVAKVQAEGDEAGQDTTDEPLPEGGDLLWRRKRVRIASPERVLRAVREPWRVSPGSLYSAVMPPGKLPTEHLGAPYDELLGERWPTEPLWIVAVHLDVGERVVFGRDEIAGDATVGQAVQASCAVPGYFAPVSVGEERYVDGAVHSTTNADLAADDTETHLVVISAPMSPARLDVDLSPRGALRQIATRWLGGEVAALRRRGVDTLTFQPTADDLEAMAGNTMDLTKAPEIIEQVNASVVRRLHEPEVADLAALLGA